MNVNQRVLCQLMTFTHLRPRKLTFPHAWPTDVIIFLLCIHKGCMNRGPGQGPVRPPWGLEDAVIICSSQGALNVNLK